VQIVFVYFALPQMTGNAVNLTDVTAGIVALSVNEGAYMAEIIRAGIMSVEAGQTEAAQSLGMTYWTTMRRIIVPQAVRIVVPPTGNEFISMLKNTSLLSVISTPELLYEQQQLSSATFRFFEPLSIIALWYLAMTTVATIGQTYIEKHFERGFVRETQEGFVNRFLRDLGGMGTLGRTSRKSRS